MEFNKAETDERLKRHTERLLRIDRKARVAHWGFLALMAGVVVMTVWQRRWSVLLWEVVAAVFAQMTECIRRELVAQSLRFNAMLTAHGAMIQMYGEMLKLLKRHVWGTEGEPPEVRVQ